MSLEYKERRIKELGAELKEIEKDKSRWLSFQMNISFTE